MQASVNGFTTTLVRALYDRTSDRLFYLELAGLSEVDAVSAATLADHDLSLELKDDSLQLSVIREGFTFTRRSGETEPSIQRALIHWHWKKKSYGPLKHAILYPEVMNNVTPEAPYPRVVVGRTKQEARRNLYNFLQHVIDIPIPEPPDIPVLHDFLHKAEQNQKAEILDIISPLAGAGEIYGYLISDPIELGRLLRKFYSRMIQQRVISLNGRPVELKDRKLDTFLNHWGGELAKKIVTTFKPLYQTGKGLPELDPAISKLLRKPFPAQREVVNALHVALFKHNQKRAVLCGEQGTGKTYITLALIGSAPKPMRTLVVCPPHLVKKWIRETRETLPDVNIVNLNGRDVLKKLARAAFNKTRPQKHEIWVIGRERLKLSCGWKPAAIPVDPAARKPRKLFRLPTSRSIPSCPHCFTIVQNTKKDQPISWNELQKARRKCHKCGSPLWQTDGSQLRRFAPAEFIKKRLKGFFDLLVVDECHEYKSKTTAQANAIGAVLPAARQALFLTGTLMGGYASDLFYLYYRAFPSDFKRAGWKWSDGVRFCRRYGIVEQVEVYKDDTDNRWSRGKKSRVYVRVRPGVSPEVLSRFLLSHTVFIRLEDMAENLPPYEEHFISILPSPQDNAEYERCLEAYQSCVASHRNTKARLIVASKFVPVLMNLPDCVRHLENEIIRETRTEDGTTVFELLHKTAIVPGSPLAKENWLIDLVSQETSQKRKVLVYCTYTREKDITRRLHEILQQAGFRTGILPASVDTDQRECWIKEHAPNLDVLICNPKLVETGLDLFDFPTVVFFQPGYRIYTLRQAARRSWRLGQNRPVRVYFVSAEGTIQEDAWALIAQKWNVALSIEGELPTDGLAAQADAGGSILGDLARRLATGELGKLTAENAFKQLKTVESRSQTFITEENIQPKASLHIETQLKEASITPPRTLIVSVLRKDGGKKVRWVRMEVKPEEFNHLKEKTAGPIQLALF